MRKRTISMAAFLVAVWSWAPAARAGQTYSGGADYQVFCSSCHGTGARGDGVIAKSLPKRPADLTRLAERNKGVFPDEKVARTIDGRETLSAHGNSDMPAWGEVFAKAQESQGLEKTKARIAGLVDYLKTLQENR